MTSKISGYEVSLSLNKHTGLPSTSHCSSGKFTTNTAGAYRFAEPYCSSYHLLFEFIHFSYLAAFRMYTAASTV
jgi:hypothetical protein